MRRFSILFAAVAVLLVPTAVARGATTPPPTIMASVGDSITRAYDATLFGCFLADCPQYSWSTGTSASVASVFSRMKATNQPLRAVNDAKTGAKMDALAGQLATAAAQNADYVTVLIGANDLCTPTTQEMTATALFESQFRQALDAYLGTTPGANNRRAFVSSIPDLLRLYIVGVQSSSARNAWRNFKICQSMLTATPYPGQRGDVVQRETAFNNILGDVCSHHPSGRCRWDGGTTFRTAFALPDLSTLDYFHPSVAGQKKLAAAAWAAGAGS